MVQQVTIDTDLSEKEAMIYLVLENLYNLSRIDIMKGKSVEEDTTRIRPIINRLNQYEPIQYILEEAYFYGRKLYVDPAVLIPRPETEFLIKLVNDRIPKTGKNIAIVDVGTGSGCIAVSLALELPHATVFATDISEIALEVAKRNAQNLKATVNFQLHDILGDQLNFGPLDMIVSNPPYISENERPSMNKNVTDHEPALALFVPDPDPLKFYKALAKQAGSYLKSGGYLITEINERFGKETATIFTNVGLGDAAVIKDLDGKDRFVLARKL